MEPHDLADLRILPFPGTDRGIVAPPQEEDAAISPGPEEDEAAGLKEALLAGRVVRGLAGKDRGGVLRELAHVLPLPAGVSRADVLRTLTGRAGRDALVVGAGVALPHPDVPLLAPGARPSITVCFLDRPV